MNRLDQGDFGLCSAALIAAVSCFLYARGGAGRSESSFRPAWLLFSLSSAMAACGNGVWGWYEVVLRRGVPPTPSFADFFFLCFAPPAIVGLLVLAKRPVTRAGWVCLALDSWLIGGSLLTLSWSLALAHTAHMEGAGESTAHAALALAYPLLDIVLVSMVLALHFRRSSAQPVGGEHRDRGARPDRAVRRAVHLPAAARALPLWGTPGRGLVRRGHCCSRTRPGAPAGFPRARPTSRSPWYRGPCARRAPPAARPPCR